MPNNFISQLNIDNVQVYVATFDDNQQVGTVEPAIRNDLIVGTADCLTRQQRYCVWKLLDYALSEQLGVGVADLHFAVDDNGKWYLDNGVQFSLSHSSRGVAAALCNDPVGVDLQLFEGDRFDARLAKRILSISELAVYNNIISSKKPLFVAEKWSQKESLFKLDGGKVFTPQSINAAICDRSTTPTYTAWVTLDGLQYVLSVATRCVTPVHICHVSADIFNK